MKKMNNYWQERFKQIEEKNFSNLKNDFKDIEKNFEEMKGQLNAEIEKWYYRIAENNEVSIEQARRLLEKEELKEFKWTLKEYIEKGKKNSINQKWIKELENASAKVHINKFEAMKINIDNYIQETFHNNEKTVENSLINSFDASYINTAFEFQKCINLGYSFNVFDRSKVENVIKKPWGSDGLNFSDRIWKNKNMLINNLQNEILRNFVLGNEPSKAVKSISRFVDKEVKNKKYASMRLLQTESAYFGNLAMIESFKDLGVEEYEIIATLDTHTSEICREMDKKHYKLKDAIVGVNMPPFHVNCRSVTCPYFDDEFSKDDFRASRDEDEKTTYVPNDISYKQWYDKYVKGNDKALLNERMTKNRSADFKQYEKFKNVLENSPNMPKTLEKFKDLKYNNIIGWERLQDNYFVNKKIKNNDFAIIINEDKQKPHNFKTKLENKSYLLENVDAQELFDKYAGTGIAEKNKNGRTHKEICTADNIIGYCIETESKTNMFKIHHSKNRTHIVPHFNKELKK